MNTKRAEVIVALGFVLLLPALWGFVTQNPLFGIWPIVWELVGVSLIFAGLGMCRFLPSCWAVVGAAVLIIIIAADPIVWVLVSAVNNFDWYALVVSLFVNMLAGVLLFAAYRVGLQFA